MSQVTFQGAVMFIGDQKNSYMSALSLHSSSIELSSSAQLQFINNSALNGAGIHLVGSSSIILNNGSTLMFKHNTAFVQGGAIYADTCTLGQTEFCVFKHSNPALHPDDWGVNITFIVNQLTSGQANAIYVDSVQSYDKSPNYFDETFCWKGWFYSGVERELSSGPAYVNYSGQLNYSIYPGDSLAVAVILTVHDIWGNDITSDQLADGIPVKCINGPICTYDPPTMLSQIPVDCSIDYSNQSSLVYIYPLQFPRISIAIYIKRCDPSDPSCSCNEPSGSFCGICKSPATMSGNCPYSYHSIYNQSCAEGREGILCGKCSEGYAVAINDPDLFCILCNSPYYGVIIFLLLQLVPVLIMLTLLAVLHILY